MAVVVVVVVVVLYTQPIHQSIHQSTTKLLTNPQPNFSPIRPPNFSPLLRVGLFHQLATLPAHPESVPINALVAVKGTPFQDHEAPTGLDIARCVATARILMPKTVVRLSAGRMNFSFADQALCFLAGANSIFDGDKLLTTPNNDRNEDLEMFDMLGLRSRPAFLPYESGQESSKEAFDDASATAGAGDDKVQKMTA